MPFEPVSFNICCERINMKFVHIPPGTFMMGSPKTLHRVTLTKGFYMQTTQVTQKQWKALTGNNPTCFRNNEECPVEDVSWHTEEFLNKALSEALNMITKNDCEGRFGHCGYVI